VESVQLVADRIEGEPGPGAATGALIGGLLFIGAGGTTAIFGALTGAGLGAIASSRAVEDRIYRVAVRFDDGTGFAYVYRDISPFAPGQRVVLTPQGLRPAVLPPSGPS
jgi:outer membrane lipoprotein SlyB